VVVLAVAFLASRSCAESGGRISQDEAVDIATEQVDFEPNRVQVRFFRSGIPSTGFWAVSLALVERGVSQRRALVVVRAADGKVSQVQEQRP
jgi:hypothetical protein